MNCEKAQTMNTVEIQAAPGSRSSARQLHSKKRSGWHYNLRQFKSSQRHGGHGRPGPRGGRGPHGRGGGPRSTGGGAFRRNPAGSPGPVASTSDFGQIRQHLGKNSASEPSSSLKNTKEIKNIKKFPKKNTKKNRAKRAVLESF